MQAPICRPPLAIFVGLYVALYGAVFAARATPAAADRTSSMMTPSPGLECRQAIAIAEKAANIPPHLLAAIARIESGRRDPQSGTFNPWPWSINVEGIDHIYESKPQVIAAVRAFQAGGVRSIDVGCMQVNLMYHASAFASLEQAFDPQINADYAARFLTQLYQQTGTWEKATAWYHSATPGLGEPYQRKVAAAMPEEERIAMAMPGLGTMGPSVSVGRPIVSSGGFGGGGMQMLPHMDRPRLIPMPSQGGALAMGRSLDSYRSLPIMLASRR